MAPETSTPTRDVVVVVGAGGIGLACARRLGSGRTLLLADQAEDRLAQAAAALSADGFDVHRQATDVTDPAGVGRLAARAAALGVVRALVHTAGVSPAMADADVVLAVDLLGTALLLDGFETVATSGTVGVVIASMAGSLMTLDPAVEHRLATAPAAELPVTAQAAGVTGPADAYCLAKRGNQLRVQAAAARWGRRGGRVVSVSPGMVSTGMGRLELGSDTSGESMRLMLEASPVPRLATAEDIAAAVAWLCGPEASFVTGVDLLVDGGVTAASRFPAG